MSDVVIKIENLSKLYRLGLVSTGTLGEDICRFWAKVRGKEDPFLKIGESNDRSTKGSSDYVLALKDINLEVKRGERLGIIGKNGAGKSTLLKILSQVTGPTKGTVKMKGRVGSLLEVGTGFHGELTGRENIYMNGTILGMSHKEVSKKIDEIIDFAGVERYIDTPVKRYSSGMTVRLGFAVAAHLEPDILIVDEVLAVGDAEFQKKAIGKMKDVSEGQGRTILFVSHNMHAIKNLCPKSMLIQNGSTNGIADTDEVVESYLTSNNTCEVIKYLGNIEGNLFRLTKAELLFEGESVNNGKILKIKFDITSLADIKFSVIMNVYRKGSLAFASTNFYKKPNCGKGNYEFYFEIQKYLLNPGFHSIEFSIVDETGNATQYLYAKDLLKFTVHDDNYRRGNKYNKAWEGLVSPILNIDSKKVNI